MFASTCWTLQADCVLQVCGFWVWLHCTLCNLTLLCFSITLGLLEGNLARSAPSVDNWRGDDLLYRDVYKKDEVAMGGNGHGGGMVVQVFQLTKYP